MSNNTPAADAVREAFEDWVRKQDWFEPYFLYRRDMAGSTRIGQYVQGCIEITWGAWQSATARESALVAERDALRAAMDHIAKTCLASRSQSRRIRWIEARARGALLGQNDLHRMIDLPKDGGPATAEKLQRRIVHERHMHNITNGLTAGILGAALAAPAVEGE